MSLKANGINYSLICCIEMNVRVDNFIVEFNSKSYEKYLNKIPIY